MSSSRERIRYGEKKESTVLGKSCVKDIAMYDIYVCTFPSFLYYDVVENHPMSGDGSCCVGCQATPVALILFATSM
ncbi:predicted protein [Lichtheimia corymbifera JMRC:FSU:9682]|uniref:Uncharacterized protein n=1 Tax=Lichtheimia corymbifera JMRC:FSU:9682 TaxID=1263082 RepID=A0A068S6I0_9FUNG|nr:predicted protein [Lichtheimia corymbifera JMRC:FSU:9682]